MRILWFSHRTFPSHDTGGATWLDPLAPGLLATGEVELCNVSWGRGGAPTRQDDGPIQQWMVRPAKLGRDGLPPARIVAGIVKVVADYAPDIVHVWGAESYWGLLTARGIIRVPALLEIQGLKEPYARVYAGGLSMQQQISCIGPREIIRRGGVAAGRRAFRKWGRFEREIIAGHRYITTQSPWVEAWVNARNNSAQFFHAELALREPFYGAHPWSCHDNAVVFCSAAYPVPYKGFHDAVRAFALLKRYLPNARLRVAGSFRSGGLHRNGYAAWVKRLAASLRIADSIEWLGPLSAVNMVAELQGCSVMLMPSHCETYCVAMAEALYLGVPVVSAQTGGANWLARDEESALFFPAGDEVMCSYQLRRVLTEQQIAHKLSSNARSAAIVRNDLSTVVAHQADTYREIIADVDAASS